MKINFIPFITGLFLLMSPLHVDAQVTEKPQAENLFLHTDRDLYIAGEDLFFQLYLMPSSAYKLPSKIAYMALQNSANTIIERCIIRFENNIAYGSLYLPDTLSTGYYRLVFFTNRMRGYNGMHQPSRPLFIVNRFDEKSTRVEESIPDINGANQMTELQAHILAMQNEHFSVAANQETYSRRQKVELTVHPHGINDSLIYLSVSVAPDKSFVFSEVAFDNEFSNRTSGKSDGTLRPDNGFLPETQHMILGGRVNLNGHNAGLPDARVLLSTPDSILNLQYARTLPDGLFYFQINDFYLNKPLYLSLDTSTTALPSHIEVFDKFAIPGFFEGGISHFSPGHIDFIAASQDYVRVQKVYEVRHRFIPDESGKTDGFRPMVYSVPNHVIYPAMFMPLRDLQEISRELIVQLRIRSNRGSYFARLLDERTASRFFDNAPAIFLDAIPVKNVSDIAHLNSEQIERIEIQNYQWVYGSMQFPGIVSVFSHHEEYINIGLPETTRVIDGFSFMEPSFFNPPDHTKAGDELASVPDFRQLLYWQPNISLMQGDSLRVNFFTSDLKGRYLIKVEGFTSGGKRVSGISELIVK
jgi:hypothetical protein